MHHVERNLELVPRYCISGMSDTEKKQLAKQPPKQRNQLQKTTGCFEKQTHYYYYENKSKSYNKDNSESYHERKSFFLSGGQAAQREKLSFSWTRRVKRFLSRGGYL